MADYRVASLCSQREFHRSHLMLPDVSWVYLKVADVLEKLLTIRCVAVADACAEANYGFVRQGF